MNDAQRQAIASADAQMAPALELYAERSKLSYLYYRLDLPSLKRLNALLRRLSDDDLRMVAAYAEGLAEFGLPEQQSGDAEKT